MQKGENIMSRKLIIYVGDDDAQRLEDESKSVGLTLNELICQKLGIADVGARSVQSLKLYDECKAEILENLKQLPLHLQFSLPLLVRSKEKWTQLPKALKSRFRSGILSRL